MKKSKIWIYSLFLSIFIFTVGCNDGNGDDDMDPSPRMTATVDGSDWKAESYNATIVNGLTNINGIASDGSLISITLSTEQEGSYSLNLVSEHAAAYKPTSGSIAFTSNGDTDAGGQVSVDDINTQDSTISGTFSFSAYKPIGDDWVEITEGKLVEIPYTSSVPNTDEGSLTVDVDGTIWEPPVVHGQTSLGSLQITGSDMEGDRIIGITVDNKISKGTYSLGFISIPSATYNPDKNTNLFCDSGTLEITAHDTDAQIIKGTFSFEARNGDGSIMVSLTNGTFDVNY